MRLRSYAKINLFLKVLDKRPDGFHNLDSIFQSVSLYDELSIKLKDDPGIEIFCDHPLVPTDEKNIVYKAVNALPVQKTGVVIEIKKNIPVAAGLAGGSSNAAAVLFGLNQLWELGLSKERLMEIGSGIGADVAFCLVGGRARVRGKGEIVVAQTFRSATPTGSANNVFVVVKPNFEVSTAWAYAEFDTQDLGSNISDLGSRVLDLPNIHYYNSLEDVVIPKYPEIGEIKQKLIDLGAKAALMSGSGPSVFGVFEQKDLATKALKSFKRDYQEVFVVGLEKQGVVAI